MLIFILLMENVFLFYDFSLFRLVLGLETRQKESNYIFVDVFRKMPGITHSKNFYQPSILSHKHSSFVCDMTYKSMLLPLFSNKQKMRTALSVQF